MTDGGPRRTQQAQRPRRPRRGRQPRTLRTRLVVASVVLIAVVCGVIGSVTALALRSHLYEQLDGQLGEVAARASGVFRPPGRPGKQWAPDQRPGGPEPKDIRLSDFVKGPQPGGTVVARTENGTITEAEVGDKTRDDAGVPQVDAKSLTADQRSALGSVPRDQAKHTVSLPGLGGYRVVHATGPNGSFYVAIPTTEVDNTVRTLVLVEISVTVAGLVAASLAGAAIVGVALRPLRRVAATATRVSELPLHAGEVNLSERVPAPETDPRTEVGQVGLALNRMLDHIHGALHARQRSETRVRQFVADASHELRTPLASIRGYAELTRRGGERIGPDTRHALGRIESEADRMTLLVEDLLLLARLDAGRPLQFEPTDLLPLVVDTVSDARAAGPGHNWRLDLPAEPAAVSADPARLQQVLVNLLANARTHTAPGTTVTARVRRDGPWLCLDVEDDGQGIPAGLLPHVFERFARGDSGRSRATGSTGLGLAIVRAVAAAHGGTVGVDSEPGRTVFTVRLPGLGTAAAPATGLLALPVTGSPAFPVTGPSALPPAVPARPAPCEKAVPGPHSQAQHSVTTSVRQGG
ncbi:sensor histidine kinase [Streptomyces sp. NPDC018057]|uniref:sensor histidine kinase n=1 Tax=unclassified Streptomyces TaxID=2593676 RepID=UPI0037B8A50A